MPKARKLANNFAEALRFIRKSKGLSQEDFGDTSSRTYVSSLERGMKSPTLGKIDDLAETLGVHPLTLLTIAYLRSADADGILKVFEHVSAEFDDLNLPVK
jgi:transcriptional regulator with XRE-family HTH domain